MRKTKNFFYYLYFKVLGASSTLTITLVTPILHCTVYTGLDFETSGQTEKYRYRKHTV